MILTSKNNPLIKETASLKEKKGRKEQGAFLVEGVKMVRECQKSGMEIEKIFLTETFLANNPESNRWRCKNPSSIFQKYNKFRRRFETRN